MRFPRFCDNQPKCDKWKRTYGCDRERAIEDAKRLRANLSSAKETIAWLEQRVQNLEGGVRLLRQTPTGHERWERADALRRLAECEHNYDQQTAILTQALDKMRDERAGARISATLARKAKETADQKLTIALMERDTALQALRKATRQ